MRLSIYVVASATILAGPIRAQASATGACMPHDVATRDLGPQLAKFRRVEMPFSTSGLSAQEVRMVRKLVVAAQYVDSIYWRQNDSVGLALYHGLAHCPSAADRQLARFLMTNGGRFDLLDENKPFVGKDTLDAGRLWYPSGITRKEIDAYIAAHPAKKAELFNPLTVVRRLGNDLVGVPYHEAYRQWLEPAAQALRDAAALSSDKGFVNFLRLRADALLSDDYYKSDLAWVDLDDPKIDLIIGPYETFLDGLLGVKASYGATVMIRNERESRKLAIYKKYVADIQDALPLDSADKPSTKGHVAPMEVMDAPFRTGDIRHGYQAVADNLPNDPRVNVEKGTKRMFFKNFMDARVNYMVLPIGQRLLRQDQGKLASMDGYMTFAVMHEICHALGPAYARTKSGKADIVESIGSIYSGIEEGKADVVGLVGLEWLMRHGVLQSSRGPEYYASYVAGIFRTVRFGVAEGHARAMMAEFNYLSEQGAITRDEKTGRYAIDAVRMPVAVAGLAKELLEIEATGDRDRAARWFAQYGTMSMTLKSALAKANDIPIDVDPVDAFSPTLK
ncbi:MAG: Zn-dependent hydrolase [bacterium]